ncbi:MAG: 5-formyltetrahydrofolate cyclo-ligase [Vicinamibacterales bacterium]
MPAPFLLSPVSPTIPPGPRGKATLRRGLLARRDGLSEGARAAASAQIGRSANAVLAERLRPGSVVALYAAKGTEVDTVAIETDALARGLTVCYPRIVDGERRLGFHATTAAELVPSRFGLREPLPTSPHMALEAINAFIVPGIAFDRSGGRMGWGGGHYDATFAQVPGTLRIGLGFECQLIDRVPHDAHDIDVHIIITEVATLVVP